MKPILEIQNISKTFRIQNERQPYLSLRDSLASMFKSSKNKTNEFFALNDVSFNVMPGDTIGIIGKNGAGKSTLLKILSKITPPTSGKIISRGRIASLLEVGTGFHQELSGRENIFLNGSILGMRREEIQRNFDAIVDFSGVEKFLDTPLKHYSSGMQLRLAFAVAAFLENEILIIDEVLAVGDAEFQKKCMGKMEDVSKSGRTILFVSHNMAAVISLCAKCIYLKNGTLFREGSTENVINEYTKIESAVRTESTWDKNKLPGDNHAALHSVRLIDKNNNQLISPNINQIIGIEIIYEILDDSSLPYPNIHFFRGTGEQVFTAVNDTHPNLSGKGLHKTISWIPPNLLNEGTYTVGIALTTLSPMTIHAYETHCLTFDAVENINDRKNPYLNNLPGIVRPKLSWDCTKLN
jgi:lipopolysaccharide transport system ATP-binding protein